MNMLYRRASSRPWKLNFSSSQIFKVLFWIEFESNTDSFDALVNIDSVIF